MHIGRFPIHPACIEFGELECCTLHAAMIRPEQSAFISVFRETSQENPKHVKAVLAETFDRTTRLAFIPRSLHRSFYLKLAGRERMFLNGEPREMLSCGHSRAAHIASLERIISMMNPNINPN